MLLFKQTLVVLMLCIVVSSAFAETKLPEAQEERARSLFLELRCVVCQNQSIGDSDADVAKDLRQIVREQISAGKSNLQVKDFLVARYGEFILLKPKLALHTILLWFAPIILLVVGGFGIVKVLQRNKNRQTLALSAEEEVELSNLLNSKDK